MAAANTRRAGGAAPDGRTGSPPWKPTVRVAVKPDLVAAEPQKRRHPWPSRGHDLSMAPQVHLEEVASRPSTALVPETMGQLFEAENERLAYVVQTHFDQLGMRDMRRITTELSAQREQSLLELRRDLEERNRSYVSRLRQSLQESLESEKAELKADYDAYFMERKQELLESFGPLAQSRALDDYGDELDDAIEAKLSHMETELRSAQLRRLEELSQSKLKEREEAIQAAREQFEVEFRSHHEKELVSLESALVEGERQALEALREDLNAEGQSRINQRLAEAEAARTKKLASLRASLEADLAKRLEDADRRESEELERAKSELRLEYEERASAELAKRAERNRDERQAQLARVQAECEATKEAKVAKLEHTLQQQLTSAKTAMGEAAAAEMARDLEGAKEAMLAAHALELSRLRAEFQEAAAQARSAFAIFRRSVERNGAVKHNESDSDEEDCCTLGSRAAQPGDGALGEDETSDSDMSEADARVTEGKRAKRAPCAFVAGFAEVKSPKQGLATVGKRIAVLEKANDSLARRLDETYRKLVATTEELVLVRKTASIKNPESGQTASLRRELSDAKRLVEKLLTANRNMVPYRAGFESATSNDGTFCGCSSHGDERASVGIGLTERGRPAP